MRLRTYFNYISSLLRHKYYVFIAGRKLGVPIWRLLIHDWSKFTSSEFLAYSEKDLIRDKHDFPQSVVDAIDRNFTYAWLHHENANSHHWGYWIPRSGRSTGEPLEMPRVDTLEMVADWMGASRGYTGSWDMSEWLNKNIDRIILHPETRQNVYNILSSAGYKVNDSGEYYLP